MRTCYYCDLVWDGNFYRAVQHQHASGIDMVQVDESGVAIPDGRTANVSERVVGRTHHLISEE